MYSVEAKLIDAVVAQFGPSTKQGAIVGGQTSTKRQRLRPSRNTFQPMSKWYHVTHSMDPVSTPKVSHS